MIPWYKRDGGRGWEGIESEGILYKGIWKNEAVFWRIAFADCLRELCISRVSMVERISSRLLPRYYKTSFSTSVTWVRGRRGIV